MDWSPLCSPSPWSSASVCCSAPPSTGASRTRGCATWPPDWGCVAATCRRCFGCPSADDIGRPDCSLACFVEGSEAACVAQAPQIVIVFNKFIEIKLKISLRIVVLMKFSFFIVCKYRYGDKKIKTAINHLFKMALFKYLTVFRRVCLWNLIYYTGFNYCKSLENRYIFQESFDNKIWIKNFFLISGGGVYRFSTCNGAASATIALSLPQFVVLSGGRRNTKSLSGFNDLSPLTTKVPDKKLRRFWIL